jgi:hypothetical protein
MPPTSTLKLNLLKNLLRLSLIKISSPLKWMWDYFQDLRDSGGWMKSQLKKQPAFCTIRLSTSTMRKFSKLVFQQATIKTLRCKVLSLLEASRVVTESDLKLTMGLVIRRIPRTILPSTNLSIPWLHTNTQAKLRIEIITTWRENWVRTSHLSSTTKALRLNYRNTQLSRKK